MTKTHFEPGDTQARKGGIGASDAGTVAGVNKFKSPYQLWAEKTSRYQEDLSDNPNVKWGNRLEEVVAKAIKEDFGVSLIREPDTHFNDQHGVPLFCHMDGYHYVEGGIRIDEIKCPSVRSVWSGHYPKNGIPPMYIYQGIHMAIVLDPKVPVMGIDYWVFVDREIKKFSFEWDQEARDLGNAYIEQAKTFWNHVVKDTPPEVTHETDLGIAFPSASSDFIEFDGDEYHAMKARIEELDEQKKAADAEISNIKFFLKKMLGDHDSLRDENGNVLATWKDQSRSSFDTKAFKEAHPELWEAFQKQSQFRTLRLK